MTNLFRYFTSKPKRPTVDSCCKSLHTRTTKNQKLLTVRRSGKSVMIVVQQKL